MRIAYLILAHRQSRHVGRLVEQLDDGNARFFIHVDRKSDIAPFRQAIASDRATFLDERLSIKWGGWRMVQATLNLLQRARREGSSDYYQLLSGSCYPIKSNAEIVRKLRDKPLNYITINHELTQRSPHFWWTARRHWPDLVPAQMLKRWLWFSRRLAVRLPARRPPHGLRVYKGWQWWCLRHDCAGYVLNHIETHPELIRFFRHTYIPDETFFHTIIANSPYAGTLSPGFAEGTITGNHYIRWAGGKPRVLRADAFDTLIESDACFARKFDENDSSQLIAMLRDRCRVG